MCASMNYALLDFEIHVVSLTYAFHITTPHQNSFTDLSKSISSAWRNIDDETKLFCAKLSDAGNQHYKKIIQTRRKSDASATSEAKAAAIKHARSARKRKSDASASDVVSDFNRVTTTQSLMPSGSLHNEPRFKFPDLCISSTREISNASSSNAAASTTNAATSPNHYDHSSDASCVDLSDDDILDMYMKS